MRCGQGSLGPYKREGCNGTRNRAAKRQSQTAAVILFPRLPMRVWLVGERTFGVGAQLFDGEPLQVLDKRWGSSLDELVANLRTAGDGTPILTAQHLTRLQLRLGLAA